MFKFFARQSFVVNLLAAIILIFLIGFLFFQSLGWITNHGSFIKVPSVTGMKVDKAMELLEKQGLEVIITDSAYDDRLELNTVKKQLPDANATVKVNRTVFLNVNPVELPMVAMPKLEGLSYRFALNKLEKSHLILGDTVMRADFMKGSVLEQKYKGSAIDDGTKIRWGSKIDLIVGGGLQEVKIRVPDLIGATVEEAKDILKNQGIILAAILTSGPITDTLNAYVFKQNPEVYGYDSAPIYIQPGQTMDIWIQKEKPVSDSVILVNPPPPILKEPKTDKQ
ncbi:MAG: PASTA domain-containing protein [Ginsengibacter sp.]